MSVQNLKSSKYKKRVKTTKNPFEHTDIGTVHKYVLTSEVEKIFLSTPHT